MFRAALFSIVLTLAVGQNASLLCKVWCHDATSAGCPHQESTLSPDPTGFRSVSADDNCGSAFVGAVAFVREDARRTAADPDAQNALVVPRFRLAPCRLLTCALASSRAGGCRSKNDLSLPPSESKSLRRSRLLRRVLAASLQTTQGMSSRV